MLARSGKSAGSTLSLAAGRTGMAVATCCVRTGDLARERFAVGEVVSPGFRGWAFASGQGQVHGPGAENRAGADRDQYRGAVGAGAHRRAVPGAVGTGRVLCRARVLTMTAGPG